MTEDRKRASKAAKSETLTIRLDQKTRFMLEFMARLRGQSLTTVVERAIVDAADNATINSYDGESSNWRNFWHVSEGVRALMIAGESALYPNYDEEFLYSFAKEHWPFFFTSDKKNMFNVPLVNILWPDINKYISLWKETKSTDYFATGKAMQEAISKAGVVPPEWPIKSKQSRNYSDIDDEIPF